MNRIGVLGLWHLGCVYSACFADKGFVTIAFDANKDVVKNLKANRPPIFEPELGSLIGKNNGKKLLFTDSINEAVSNMDYVFITPDIPVDNNDTVQLKEFNSLLARVAKLVTSKTVLVISSQVPVGTCRSFQAELRRGGKNNQVLYLPENLRLGQAIDVFLKPERIILGGDNPRILKRFIKDFSFFNAPTLEMSLESAEMSKHALNSYLATMISFSSEIGDLCEEFGADANDVAKALKSDKRVSPNAPLSPGIGFAGGTLGRDLQTLKMVSKQVKYKPKLIRAVYEVNQDRLPSLVKKVTKVLGTLKGKKVGLLGLTYKPNTDTLRRSQSIEMATELNKKGVEVRAIDPAIQPGTKLRSLVVYENSKEFFQSLDAIILMTGWEDFKKLKPASFASNMKKKIVFDSRNFLDEALYKKSGFKYVGVGKSFQ